MWTANRKKICIIGFTVILCGLVLIGRLIYLMLFTGDYYSDKAKEVQQRERTIRAPRGRILDRNGEVLAGNRTECTISVVHNQITDPEGVIAMLTRELGLKEEEVRKKIEKYSSLETIKSGVELETGERILSYGYDGVKVDEDYTRYYPYGELASKVLGFTGSDNQGITGLESVYDSLMTGENGTIFTTTDARGLEVSGVPEERKEPKAGEDLVTSIDVNIQLFAMQAAEKAYIKKQADSVEIIVMKPDNGEVLAMVDYPEYDLNDPFTLTEAYEETDDLNQMWRNRCINDTYEPGSTFKIVTTTAAIEEGLVSLSESFNCPGYIVVEDRRIRCHKTEGHGTESFVEALENSCNPVFINVGLRIGADRFYSYFEKLGLLGKTGIDLPGEASAIMHERENIGLVELATISFGQSFQITPIQLAATACSLINGGTRVTPHFNIETEAASEGERICSEETSETLRELLLKVVSEGGGANAYIEGYEIGGKTATSQTLPRSDNRYIASFLGFAPADDPQVFILVIINNPQGTYYGGQIAAPVAKEIFENILPYLEIE